MATDYLELNREVLEELKESDPVKYRSLKLYLECQNIYAETSDWSLALVHWNNWARKLLAERKKLEGYGKWLLEENFFRAVGKNEPTQDWLDAAKVDFSDIHFYDNFSEDNTKEGKDANSKTNFLVLVQKLSFANFEFPSDADFMGTLFNGDIQFVNVIFSSGFVDFERSIFNCDAMFVGAKFSANTRFYKAIFCGNVNFFGSNFSSNAWFSNATFRGDTKFWYSRFKGCANFHLSQFEQQVSFWGARFQKKADFPSIRSEKGFSLHEARFRVVPDFNEAAFHAPPVLDAVHVGEQLTAKRGRWPFRFRHVPEPEKNAKRISRNFRALGKMAHEARDWLNEMEFFAQEIRTRRFGEDFPLGEYRLLRGLGAWLARKCRLRFLRPVVLKLRRKAKASPFRGPNPGRFWFGLIYEVPRDVFIMH